MIKKLFSNYNLILLFIILVAIFLRFYQIGSIPAGLTNDEVNIGYDAYSILMTGRDQWGELYPILSFKGFGDFRPSLYTYLVLVNIPIFDLSSIAVRFPSAVFGVVLVFVMYLFLSKFFSKTVGIAGSLLLAITPWAIGISRIGLESNIAPVFLLCGILFIVHYTKNKFLIYISFILFSLTLYTYSAYALLMPLVIIAIIIFYYRLTLNNLKNLIIGLLLFFILCLPLFISQDSGAKVRFSQINFMQNINSIGIINKLNDQQGECRKIYPLMVCKLTFNKITVFGTTLVKNYVSHFSFNFLYLNGTETQLSMLPQRGLLYVFELFLFVSGIIWIIRKKNKAGFFIITLLLVSAIPDSITSDGNYSRAFVMLPFLISIEALGFLGIYTYLQRYKIKFIKYAYLFFSISILIYSTIIFFINYTTYFKVFNSRFSSYGYEELMQYIHSNKANYSQIYLSRHLNDTKQYIYYLFYTSYDPVRYQNKKNVKVSVDQDGWIKVENIDNIYFVDNIPDIDTNLQKNRKKILLISHPADLPRNAIKLKSIKDLKNDVLFDIVTVNEYLIAK